MTSCLGVELTPVAEALLFRPLPRDSFPSLAGTVGREQIWASRRGHPTIEPAVRPATLRAPQVAHLSFNITPYLGINNARYGMLRREVRQALGQATWSVRRQSHGPAEDVYGDRHAFFRYDASDRLQTVEFAPTADLSIGHYRVSGLTAAELREQVLEWDPSAAVCERAIRSSILGLTIGYEPNATAYASIIAGPDRCS
jgi:hypothetical protein